MHDININVINKTANVIGDPKIVCGNKDYVIHFTFDDDWTEYSVKTARFFYNRNGVQIKQEVVFTGNDCPVPMFVNITFLIVGVYAGDLCTTTPALIFCRKSILCSEGVNPDPAPDVYAQIMELINSGQLQGPAGDSGATYTPEVSDDGELSWTNDRGLDNPEPVNIRGPQGKEGSPGPQGPPGDNTAALEAAQVAIDAADNANAAADAARELAPEVEQIKNELSDLAPAGAAVGQLFRVAAVSENGKYTMEPVDMLDVRVAGETIVTDGAANIPVATTGHVGVVQIEPNYGISIFNKRLTVQYMEPKHVGSRSGGNRPLCVNTLDYAVKAAMCDGKGAAWTDAERIAALLRMGCTVDENGFVHWIAQEVTA